LLKDLNCKELKRVSDCAAGAIMALQSDPGKKYILPICDGDEKYIVRDGV
jgi:hypothetical protein